MTTLATEGDDITVVLREVTKLNASLEEEAVTENLDATVELQNWDDEDDVVVGPTPITLNAGNAWFVSVTAPVAGRYRVIVVAEVDNAQRTFAGELKVGPPPT